MDVLPRNLLDSHPGNLRTSQMKKPTAIVKEFYEEADGGSEATGSTTRSSGIDRASKGSRMLRQLFASGSGSTTSGASRWRSTTGRPPRSLAAVLKEA